MSNSGFISLASAAVDMVEENDNINRTGSVEKLIKLPEQVLLKNSRGDPFHPFTSLGGGDFKPHIFIVNPGEDIIGRIMSFTQNGSRGVCVLSANGVVCNFKIQTVGYKGGLMSFEDTYELISLKGSMVINESGGVRNKTGGWQISVGGIGGNFYGGRLVGQLIAAGPVQVVVGSFWPLVVNPSQKRSNEFQQSVVVTPTIPNIQK